MLEFARKLVSGNIRKGWRLDVPEWTWGTLATPARNANNAQEAGGIFGLEKGGTITIIGTDDEFGVLVRYHIPRNVQEPAGTCAPDGALFFMRGAQIANWPIAGEMQQQMDAETMRRNSAVSRLLREE